MLIAVNLKGTTVLHWGVSKRSAGEWLAPPSEILPERSKLLDGACQTYFKEISSGHGTFRHVAINFQGRNFMGVQFVLWSGGSWIKNNGSNYYISLKSVDSTPRKINELKCKMKSAKISWPGDEGEERWEQAWQSIKKVWASKWNERAYISCKKAKFNHGDLCMAVLVQELISADYAFVIHTKNPLSGDSTEIYIEIVKGLGETLVGAYPGRAMSFITRKSELKSPIIVGYPSKQIGLFIKKSIIFRSDSNGEDLQGYAGAGLYDSECMDKEDRIALDYSCDRLICDKIFRNSIFSRIAEAGMIIEDIYRSHRTLKAL